MVLSGLTADKARPHGDGGGDHARAMASFLTGRQPRKTDGADIRVGISADQVAAEKVGHATRFASLEIGCEGGKNAGNCDSGYSCAYSSNLSWRGESLPMSKEINPQLVFDRLFSTTAKGDGDQAPSRPATSRASSISWPRTPVAASETRLQRPAQARRISHRRARIGTAHRQGAAGRRSRRDQD